LGIVKEEVLFPCSGVYCHGVIYRPKDGKDKLPVIVMAMGFGMIKEIHSDDYGPIFAEKGFAVLAFDYRRFGKSQGEPRQALYPEDQVSDYRCAIAYMRSQPYADPDKICVWGTSFSGGHVITLLAFPSPGVKCGIAQVPNVYSYYAAMKFFGNLDPVLMLAEQGRRECCKGEPMYIPIVSREGLGILATEEAINYYLEKASKYPGFENRITLDSIDRILAYNPGYYAGLVSKPLLAIIAKKDKTTPPDVAIEALKKVKKAKVDIIEYDVGHFDIYEPPLLEEIARKEAEWSLKTLREG